MNDLKDSNEQNYFRNLRMDKMSVEFIVRFNRVINNLKEYGIFIVPNGVRERWLNDVECNESEGEFVAILKKIDQTENPANNDIWKFIDDIAVWISNPDRKGISS